jgi:hypothetical protein
LTDQPQSSQLIANAAREVPQLGQRFDILLSLKGSVSLTLYYQSMARPSQTFWQASIPKSETMRVE